jgi:cysteine synthase
VRPAAASALDTIGGTPAVFLDRLAPAGGARIVAKLEYFGPTGSHKDRVALALVEAAERRGDIEPGMTLVDYTGGSTGAALAVVCSLKGYGCTVVCSDAYSREKLRSMAALGAGVEVVPSRGGTVDHELIPRMMARAAELGARPGCFYLDMHHREDPVGAGEAIGGELLEQVGRPIAAFCSGFGTGALLMGVARALRSASPPARVVALEPASSAVLSGGAPGSHRIEGLGYGFVPALLDRALLDEVLAVEEDEARDVARALARVEGVFAGTSSGCNVAGALRLAARLGPGQVVATACCDTGFKYTSGDLFDSVG